MLISEPVPQSSRLDSSRLDSSRLDFCPEALLTDRAHIQRIAQIARKQTRGSTLDWEDAAQSAQIKILQAVKLGKFHQGDRQAFFRWATTVAKFEIIDLVRRDQRQRCTSLDQSIAGLELTWLDTVADSFDALDSLIQADRIERVRMAIHQLEQQYPAKSFLALWQGQIQGKNQTELAAALGITQSAVSKRWKELVQKIAEQLGLFETGLPQLVQTPPQQRTRARSTEIW
jgi:RNA polymerase sigma factor (sigma-70 family)